MLLAGGHAIQYIYEMNTIKIKLLKNPAIFAVCAAVCILVTACSSLNKEFDPYANSIRPSILGDWVLVRMSDETGELHVTDGITMTLPEEPRNAIHGCAGVNLYNGVVDIPDKTFKAGAIGTTKMAGLPAAMESEQNYLRILALCNTIVVETVPAENAESLPLKRLILLNKEKNVRLEFVK